VNLPSILVVDDQLDMRTVLAATLRRAGYEVTTANDGVDALEKLAAEIPDMVLTDLMMPRVDGLELLRRIRERPETAHVPVIMLTTRAELADKMAGFERGADDYVAKPFEPKEVIARVQALLKRTEQTRLTAPLMGFLGTWSTPEGLEQFSRDLGAARDIQSRLIPAVPARLAGLQAGAVLLPSSVVGGDFFDVFPMGDRIGVAVGEVSGKGLAAALLMVMVRTLLREIAAGCSESGEVLPRLNVSLCRDMPPSMFVTIVLAVLEPGRDGQVLIANGGHPEPVVMRRGAPPKTLDVGGMVMGAFPQATFGQGEVMLEPGDTLVLFTTGVVETPDERGRRPGLTGFYEVLAALGDRPAPALAQAVAADVVRRGGTRMRDDVTVFVLKR
jgi:sigma-B regulation protein RsbU (phosphoserine phosphatase)